MTTSSTSSAPSPHLFSYRLPGGPYQIGLVAKRAYRIPQRGAAEPLADVPIVWTEPDWIESHAVPGTRRFLHDSDKFATAKPATDVLLLGTAHSRRGNVRALDTAIEVGPVRKTVHVEGDRTIERAPDGGLRFGPAEGFETLPLTWERAYGGRDLDEEQRRWPRPRGKIDPRVRPDPNEPPHGTLTYPRNYVGRGYRLGPDAEARLVGTLAPNLEDPAHPLDARRLAIPELMDWIDGPIPACYAPIDYFTFPRAMFVLRPDFNPPRRRPYEIDLGALRTEDLDEPASPLPTGDPRAYLCAPPGLGSHRLLGHEPVKLWNLHRDRDLVAFDLPGDRPTVALTLPGVGVRTLEPHLATVLLEPDEDRLTLTWGAALDVAMVFPDEALAEIGVHVRFPR
ncbi:DUF2169 domain-containing protein [Chondromyces crocatus]|uniref:DUF2169 domain-containing protein n=1 Tax=Chondromyces crocatus TaxID=52 RepID=A0A0K1EFT9_CHOCO|nr:DUF2169 domain-containing protein [Chondromyces crocatus]AKT39709.1 uncharacterized protein CMC5_038580 [Chondromyces crocatus]